MGSLEPNLAKSAGSVPKSSPAHSVRSWLQVSLPVGTNRGVYIKCVTSNLCPEALSPDKHDHQIYCNETATCAPLTGPRCTVHSRHVTSHDEHMRYGTTVLSVV
jgi:hypothetical protein